MMFLGHLFLICTFLLLVEGYPNQGVQSACGGNRFQCSNGACLPVEWACNGNNDCGDNSDEINCTGVSPPKTGTCPNQNNCNNNSNGGQNGCGNTGNTGTCPNHNNGNNNPNGGNNGCGNTGKTGSCPNNNNGNNIPNGGNNGCGNTGNTGTCPNKNNGTCGYFPTVCKLGYTLQSDKKTCKIEKGDKGLMVFSVGTEVYGNLEGEGHFLIADNLQYVVGVAVDKNYIYWSDVKTRAIYRNRDDHTEPIVTAGLGAPEAIAVDWVGGNIYFTDNFRKQIGVCMTDGSRCTVIVSEGLDKPRGLALNPMNGDMYCSDYGEKPHISVWKMDGKNGRPLVTTDLIWPNGLGIDYSTGRLYWVDAKLQTMESIRLDGSDRRLVAQLVERYPFSASVYLDTVHWSNWNGDSVELLDKNVGTLLPSTTGPFNNVYSIAIYHPVLQSNLPNPCYSKPCEHMCLLAGYRVYSCVCPMGTELSPDKHTCTILWERAPIVISTGKTMYGYTHEMVGNTKVFSSPLFQKITHVAYNALENALLAYDQVSNKILYHNGANNETRELITNVGSEGIGGLGFDFYGNNIYYSDTRNRVIVIHSLTTGFDTNISLTDEPFDILLIPEDGLLFVVLKSGGSYRIEKLDMSGVGTRRRVVEGLKGPKISLAYDNEYLRIYWADQGTGTIESMLSDGLNRRLFTSWAHKPVTLAILEDKLFWTAENSTRLRWANKNNEILCNSADTERLSVESGILDLVVVRNVDDSVKHPCRVNNGGCSHVCLVDDKPNSRICACPSDMIYSPSKQGCDYPSTCTKDQILCSSNNACINKMQRCDGNRDCPDGEDEQQCRCTYYNTCG